MWETKERDRMALGGVRPVHTPGMAGGGIVSSFGTVDEAEIPIALGAEPKPLQDVLQITVDDGALTVEELNGIVAAVQAMAGKVVNLIDFIPQSWQPFVMTREQAEQAGYFA